MKFADLKFTSTGCCGTHTWAEVHHPNGLRTEVYDCDDDNATGPYTVATWMGRTLYIGALDLPDQSAVEARLAEDAGRVF